MAYCADFDCKALYSQFTRNEVRAEDLSPAHPSWPKWCCAMEEGKRLRVGPRFTLACSYKQAFNVKRGDFHNAIVDAKATAELWLRWNLTGQVDWENLD